MIYNHKLTYVGDRDAALKYIAELKSKTPNFTLIDVGANANPWTVDYVTHVVDVEPQTMNVKHFTGNISDIQVWDEVLEYVKVHGKFDFLVSTHTIEDISAASLACTMFSRIAKEGFIAIPSKYKELSRFQGPWRGYIHHRWIYDVRGDQFLGYPKQSFIDYMAYIEDWANKNAPEGRDELQLFWKDELKLNIVNHDHLGPTGEAVMGYYYQLVTP